MEVKELAHFEIGGFWSALNQERIEVSFNTVYRSKQRRGSTMPTPTFAISVLLAISTGLFAAMLIGALDDHNGLFAYSAELLKFSVSATVGSLTAFLKS